LITFGRLAKIPLELWQKIAGKGGMENPFRFIGPDKAKERLRVLLQNTGGQGAKKETPDVVSPEIALLMLVNRNPCDCDAFLFLPTRRKILVFSVQFVQRFVRRATACVSNLFVYQVCWIVFRQRFVRRLATVPNLFICQECRLTFRLEKSGAFQPAGPES
jgi:hypothetical protein